MNDKEELAQAVLDLLKRNSNKRYKNFDLTRIFKVSSTAMNRVCESLPLKSSVESKRRVWYFESEEDKSKIAARKNLRDLEKPKRDNRAMEIAIARCQADRGGEFHPISIS